MVIPIIDPNDPDVRRIRAHRSRARFAAMMAITVTVSLCIGSSFLDIDDARNALLPIIIGCLIYAYLRPKGDPDDEEPPDEPHAF